MNKIGSNMSTVKADNRKALLYLLNNESTISRRDIAIKLGLTPAAVTKITSSLIDDGIIKEIGTDDKSPSTSGRRSVLLSLNTDNKYVLCINVETELTTITLCSLSKEVIIDDVINENPNDVNEHLAIIVLKAKNIMEKYISIGYNIIGCSIGVVGSVDDNGVTVGCFGIWGEGIDVKSYFEKELNIPVVAENNVKSFAQAELLYGSGRNKSNMLFFKWSQGIGSALVIDGNVYKGCGNDAAEIGHYIVNPNGKRCRCGRWGCLETETDYKNPQKSIARVAFALANSSVIISPQKVILFGSVFDDDEVLSSFKDSFKNFYASQSDKLISLSHLNSKREYIGPLAVGANKLFFQKGINQ